MHNFSEPRIVKDRHMTDCNPTDLDSHDWKSFRKTLLKCKRCGLVTTKMLFELPEAHLP